MVNARIVAALHTKRWRSHIYSGQQIPVVLVREGSKFLKLISSIPEKRVDVSDMGRTMSLNTNLSSTESKGSRESSFGVECYMRKLVKTQILNIT